MRQPEGVRAVRRQGSVQGVFGMSEGKSRKVRLRVIDLEGGINPEYRDMRIGRLEVFCGIYVVYMIGVSCGMVLR